MSITLEVPPELESQIQQAAATAGLSPDAYVLDSVRERLHRARPRAMPVKRLSPRESKLIQQINQSLSEIQWLRYRELLSKRQAETLTPDEQTELIAISDQIEEANVRRITYVAELAQLRQTTIPMIMKELGMKPVAHA